MFCFRNSESRDADLLLEPPHAPPARGEQEHAESESGYFWLDISGYNLKFIIIVVVKNYYYYYYCYHYHYQYHYCYYCCYCYYYFYYYY